jgi:hypothetical protein
MSGWPRSRFETWVFPSKSVSERNKLFELYPVRYSRVPHISLVFREM